MKTFCDCLREAIPLLRDRVRSVVSNLNGMESVPRILILTPAERIVGKLLTFDEEKVVVENLDGVTSYDLRDVLGGESSPSQVELSWVAWFPVGGYYGETREEYGGAPDPLPRDVAKVTITRSPIGEWQV